MRKDRYVEWNSHLWTSLPQTSFWQTARAVMTDSDSSRFYVAVANKTIFALCCSNAGFVRSLVTVVERKESLLAVNAGLLLLNHAIVAEIPTWPPVLITCVPGERFNWYIRHCHSLMADSNAQSLRYYNYRFLHLKRPYDFYFNQIYIFMHSLHYGRSQQIA